MQVITNAASISELIKDYLKVGKKVGFVPTMGALHEGHISLVKRSLKKTHITVCSIFVNPTQFNDKKDFETYPSSVEGDIEMLSKAGCHLLFLPSVAEIYPDGLSNPFPIDFGFLAKTLEGEHRPGHFNGMAQVVERLLSIVTPTNLFMGQKDYQQAAIVNKLIKKRRLKIALDVCATVREADGLAMSSRNVRLDKQARELAVQLSKTLYYIKRKIRTTDAATVEKAALEKLAAFPEIAVEYVAIRHAEDLRKVRSNNQEIPLVALIAARIGNVRLIDNMIVRK